MSSWRKTQKQKLLQLSLSVVFEVVPTPSSTPSSTLFSSLVQNPILPYLALLQTDMPLTFSTDISREPKEYTKSIQRSWTTQEGGRGEEKTTHEN